MDVGKDEEDKECLGGRTEEQREEEDREERGGGQRSQYSVRFHLEVSHI